MKNSVRPLLILISAAIIGAGGCKKYSGEKAAADRSEWMESLRDSIRLVKEADKADSLRIESLRATLDSQMRAFASVDNPREVEPYYILSSERGRYPLNSTGVAARITNSMQFELIAAAQGKRFDAVRLSSAGASASSGVIPPDQGLNYTSGDGLSVCAFSGSPNDSLGRFVAGHLADNIRMEYLRNGTTQTAITLSPGQKKWIADTWNFTDSRRLLDSLESARLINSRKLEILHLTLLRQEKGETQL